VSFFDKAKQAAGQAAAKAREGVEDVQQKRELGQAYGDLGRAAFELVESGEISHPKLDAPSAQIRALNEKLAESSSDGTVASDPSQPPAMPT
jgi:outer membrane murein-binding lipoprotein Lpp